MERNGVFNMKNKNDIISALFSCPKCKSDMYVSEDGKSAYCRGERRHCFDFSSDGYLSMHGTGGDSKEAVLARREFLGKGYYKKMAEAICLALEKYSLPTEAVIIDAGCGEGYYTSLLSERADMTVGFDLSKYACSSGAKAARREKKENLLYTTASVFELPIKSGAADALFNIFAPCAEQEYSRVLKRGGFLFVVGAGKNHLMGLKRVLYDEQYENGERADLPKNMKKTETVIVSDTVRVENQKDILSLFSMTPYYWRTSEADKEKLLALDSLETEIEFEINIYQNN